ncbi:MAG: GDP-mannose 4,6-dehydratase [Marinifilaceae bacterium]
MKILITGTAGFIGYHLVKLLAPAGHEIVGIDSINNYYDVNLKYQRLQECGIDTDKMVEHATTSSIWSNYRFVRMDLCDKEQLDKLFAAEQFDCVVNLAAQAGVRYSLTNPDSYIASNVTGFMNILEAVRHNGVKKLVYASSSSVYGNNTPAPFKESSVVDSPVSIYAATKKSNELMAFTYSHLYGVETIGLRFFTVYGPSGRPDMAPMLFANAIRENQTMKIFNNGNLSRDFTYVGDIVRGVEQIIVSKNIHYKEDTTVPATVYNIGHGSPVQLMEFVETIEKYMGKELQKEYVEMQPGDVYQTWADTTRLERDFQYKATTSLNDGIMEFIKWFKSYYSI